jgi:hypothetical protein
MVAVLSEPAESYEAEFDDWHENTHIQEGLTSTSWESAQCRVLTAESRPKMPTAAPRPL